MNVYGLVVSTIGFDTRVKLIDECIAQWVLQEENPRASVAIVPWDVYVLLADNQEALKYFRNNTNNIVKPADYDNYKAEIAPSYKEFESVVEARKYAEENNLNYIDTIIRFINP